MTQFPAASVLILLALAASGVTAQAAPAVDEPIASPWRVKAEPSSLATAARPIAFSFARTPAGRADEDWSRWREAGIARTSVGGRFGAKDAASGSAGFLCGLQPTPQVGGAAEARGSDAQGRFLGAQLLLPLN